MKFALSVLILIFSIFVSACSNLNQVANLGSTPNLAYEIYENKTQNLLDFDELITRLSAYDIILLGEEHDQEKHHIFQTMIIKALAQNEELDLVFEMLESNNQTTIDRANANKADIKPNQIQKALTWDSQKWHYKGYKELLQNIFYEKVNIKAGNLSKDEIAMIFAGVEPIRGEKSTTKEVQESIKALIDKQHGGSGDEELLDKLTQIQQYKDRRMADKLVHSTNKALLIAGNYHCDKSIGVPLHIEDFKSGKSVAVLWLSSDKDKEAYKNDTHSDFVVFFK